MKQFIRYLYEYQDGKRIRNVGFVKVEQGERQTVIHIHGKGLHLAGDSRLNVYLFYVEEGQCMGIWQGEIAHINPAVNYRLAFTPEDTGRASNYSVIKGVILENAGHRRFAAVWDDMPAAVEKMKVWKEKPEEDLAALAEQAVLAQEPQEQAEKKSGKEQMQEEEPAEQKPTEPEGEDPDREERMEQTQNEEKKVHYIKIRRQDIAQLKRCEWRLANNSFLLHGYYNYHHLLFIKEEEEWWLGVPGVYHPREAQAAEAFGFPRFVRVKEEELPREEDEMEQEEDFGYWCRPVKR